MVVKKKSIKWWLYFLLGGVFLFLLFLSAFFYLRYQAVKKKLRTPTQVIQEDKQRLLKEVAALIELPKEDPILATVNDKNKVKDQPFFARAENGDRVLIYPQAKKAILYRPSTKKIIEYSPVNIGLSSLTITPTMAITEAANKTTLAVYNGTKIVGLASQTKNKIEDEIKGVAVVSIGDTIGSDYKETLIIDLTGKNQKKAEELAEFLQGKVVKDLPEGEKKPEVDILVIVGR